jgi:hypothetical protein
MNEDYYKNLFGNYKKSKFGDYLIYNDSSTESDDYSYSDWNNLYNQIEYYSLDAEESEEQKDMRLAKEKADKRNDKINKILNG